MILVINFIKTNLPMCFQLPANVYREINMLKRHKLLNQQHLKLSRAAQELNKDLKQDHKRDNKEKRFSCVNGSLWWRIGYTQLLQRALDFKRLTRLSKSAHLVVFASHVNLTHQRWFTEKRLVRVQPSPEAGVMK